VGEQRFDPITGDVREQGMLQKLANRRLPRPAMLDDDNKPIALSVAYSRAKISGC
jgi:hypothetical protein